MKPQSNTLSTGLAMFSMFFGAGNVVFPLAMGRSSLDLTPFAMMGLLLTAVGVPFLGLMGMTLFNGDYKLFFGRIGKVPGFIIAFLIMGLIGPFGAIPRVIALSHATLQAFNAAPSLPVFSLLSVLVIFFLTFKRSRLIDILGKYLTPILLASLLILIIKGIPFSPAPQSANGNPWDVFISGVVGGYNTLDLLGAFFFSPIVILCLVKEKGAESPAAVRRLITLTLKASCIGASLLAIIYIGFGILAARSAPLLSSVPDSDLIGEIAKLHLGAYGGIVAVIAVALACLTTAMALVTVFAEFVHEEISRKKISYKWCLMATLGVTYIFATLDFDQIMHYLIPILYVSYPALIMLTVVNLLYKLWHFPYVKTPVALTFIYSIYNYIN